MHLRILMRVCDPSARLSTSRFTGSEPPRAICVSIMRALATPPRLAGEPRQLGAGEAEAREGADRRGGAWESGARAFLGTRHS